MGDQLEAYAEAVDFELFRPELEAALAYADGSKGGRPPFDPVTMFKILVIQAQNNLSDERAEFLISDRLSFMRFLGLSLGDRVPDATTIWLFRERLVKAGASKRLFERFDQAVRNAGYIAMSGQIVDASLVPAPKQRNTDAEKEAIKSGKTAAEIWPDEPNKAAQKDTDARWTLKIGGKVRYRPDGTPLPMIAIPVFGYKSHISIDRRYGFIRAAAVTSASHPDGRMLRQVIDRQNTGSEVWADSAYRSQGNEAWLADRLLTSRIHRRKPNGKAMPVAIARTNATKSSIRARIEHVFAHQKNRFGLFIRTIGIARAEAKMTLANLAYNFDRLIFHEKRAVTA